MLALIDLDPIVYAAGFASDSKFYIVPDGAVFQYKKDATAHCKTHGLDLNRLTEKYEYEPLDHCLHSVKKMIATIVEKTQADSYKGYLTGEGNFREQVATILPYKGNRDPNHKPHWYTEIREYLINVHKAEVVTGMEADDALGIEQMSRHTTAGDLTEGNLIDFLSKAETIICTIDKDLDCIPGWHYNPRKEEKYWVSEWEATKFFYTQVLTGDRVDNIQGVPGIGPKKANHIIKNCATEQELECAVGLAYAVYYDAPEEALEENMQLLWILREPLPTTEVKTNDS